MLTSATDGRTTLVQRSYNTALHHHAADNLYKNKKLFAIFGSRLTRCFAMRGGGPLSLTRHELPTRMAKSLPGMGRRRSVENHRLNVEGRRRRMLASDGCRTPHTTAHKCATPLPGKSCLHCRAGTRTWGPYLRQPCGTVGRKTLSRYRRATVAQYRPHTTMRHPSQKQVQYSTAYSTLAPAMVAEHRTEPRSSARQVFFPPRFCCSPRPNRSPSIQQLSGHKLTKPAHPQSWVQIQTQR